MTGSIGAARSDGDCTRPGRDGRQQRRWLRTDPRLASPCDGRQPPPDGHGPPQQPGIIEHDQRLDSCLLQSHGPATLDSDSIGIWAKVAAGGEQTITLPFDPGSGTIAEFSGFGGATITLESAGADLAGAVATYPALSPALPGQRTVLLRVDWKKTALPDPGPMTLSGWTLLGDSGFAGLGNRHRLTTFYLTDAAADVTYAAAARSSSGDGTDTGVVITAAAFVAPQPGVFVDWALDGPSDPIDDITGDVLSVSWRRGASYEHVSSPGPGSATLIVDNSTGKYNPDNSGGSLYGYLVPGRPVWCGALRDTGAFMDPRSRKDWWQGR